MSTAPPPAGEIGLRSLSSGDPDDIQYIDGDTDRVAFGMGSNGSRTIFRCGLTLPASVSRATALRCTSSGNTWTLRSPNVGMIAR